MDADRKAEARLKLISLKRSYPARLASVSLRRPVPPSPPGPGTQQPVPSSTPGPGMRKYAVLQELFSLKQEIQDEFSKAQLKLRDIAERLDDNKPPSAADADSGSGVNSSPPFAAPGQKTSVGGEGGPEGISYEKENPPAPSFGNAGTPAIHDENRPGRHFRVLAAVAVCAVAFTFLKSGFNSGTDDVFPMPHTRAAGLCLGSGERLFFADPQRQLLFTVSAQDGQVKTVQGFHVVALTGLAFDGISFWSAGSGGIARHEAPGRYQPARSYPEAGSAIAALDWDGKYLWTAGPGSPLMRYLPGERLIPSGSYTAPAAMSAGFHVAGENLYILDPSSARLRRYKIGAGIGPGSEAALGPFIPGKCRLAGFALDKSDLWLITENPPELRRIKLKRLRFSPIKH